MGLRVGVCGAGSFARSFIPLFQAHPLVEDVALAEVLPERRAEQAARFGIRETYPDLDALCASDVDVIALFTQRHLHGPQALQALRAGKHVYSAVPMGVTIDELRRIVSAVEETGLTYMMGETSYYYPSTVLCRDRFRRGAFGAFVYGEGEYYHDMSHGFYEAYQHSGGAEWKRVAGFPPMLYPSHSVSMILSVTGARMTQVSCLGYEDQLDDGVFGAGNNLWDNPYSNETALFRTSDGGMCRINEFRRVGVSGGRSVRLSVYGTEAAYEEQADGEVWVTRDKRQEDLRPLLKCAPSGHPAREDLPEDLRADFHSGLAPVHPRDRLPDAFRHLPNGHHGSHQFLVDDFCRSCSEGVLAPNHVWAAARYCAPGIVAHESALQEGRLLEVPHLGEPPASARYLEV
ncbi:MAG: Gfo/Idh/MocA family oxidoreductase [Chloroflexi bacterium]|nr:Gfo/Idh/MocA family oxidoreductase [Chloroflexota bacterium]